MLRATALGPARWRSRSIPPLLARSARPRLVNSTTPPVLIPDGSLWTTGPGGVVESFAAGVPHTRTNPATGRFTLLAAEQVPVIADVGRSTALVLNPATGKPSRAVAFDAPGSTALISGNAASPYLLGVGPGNADLEMTDLATAHADTIAVGAPSSSRARYGQAVVQGNRIFVPDYGQGAVIVAQVLKDKLSLVGQVAVGITGPFDLLTYSGNVWFDNPDSNLAGIITGTSPPYRSTRSAATAGVG